MAAPGTIPPPSTRSNSAMPLGQCATDSAPISVMGRAMRPSEILTGATPRLASPTVSDWSMTVPHDWHSPQRPTHLTLDHPHSVQRKLVVVLAIPSA
jgi:hypothetical protein